MLAMVFRSWSNVCDSSWEPLLSCAVSGFFLATAECHCPQNWDGSGGNGAALRHFEATGSKYPLVVKLGTITPHGADVFSYAPDENDMVEDPKLVSSTYSGCTHYCMPSAVLHAIVLDHVAEKTPVSCIQTGMQPCTVSVYINMLSSKCPGGYAYFLECKFCMAYCRVHLQRASECHTIP